MAIDTIFLCFCEDSSRNDGINKPYYMSRVRTFIEAGVDSVLKLFISIGLDAICGEQQESFGCS